MSAPDEQERRLRQLAETAGSRAPTQMRRAIERKTPPDARPWNAASRPQRVAIVLVWVTLIGTFAAVGALMAARGYGLVVVIFIVSLVVVMFYAKREARRAPPLG